MRRIFGIIALTLVVKSGLAWAGPAGASGPITVDSTTFVAGQSVMGTDGGVYSDTLPPIASTTTAAFRMTKYRAEHVNLRDSSGVEFGTTGNPLHTTGTTTVQISTVQVVNSTISVTGSTVTVNGSVTATISGTPNVAVTNTPHVYITNPTTTTITGTLSVTGSTVTVAPQGGSMAVTGTFYQATQPVSIAAPLTVFLATTSVSGSTVTVSNSNLNVTVTNSPTVSLSGVPNVRISSPIASGTNNIGTVSGSTVTVVPSGSSLPVSITGTPNVYVTNPTTTTITGSVSVTGSTVNIQGTVPVSIAGTVTTSISNSPTVFLATTSVSGSTVTISGTANVAITNAPNVNVANVPNVNVANTPSVTVTNSSFSVSGSTVNATINGTVPVVFSGTSTVTFNGVAQPVSVSGTPTVNAAQSGAWLNTIQVLNESATPTSVGYSGGATQLPAAITDGVLVASMTSVGGKSGLNVNIIGGAGAGGSSSNYAATFPTAGNASGFVNPSGNMQAARVDVSSNLYVNVANTSLSVTGSTVSITGSVTISTATPFNVSGSTVVISGTPNVNVSNTPNVSVTNTPNVSVTNTVGTTLTAQLPTGTNNIGTVSGSTVSISGSIAATISGTINTYQTNPSTVTFNGVAQPVTATISGTPSVFVATTSVSGSTIAVTNVSGQNLNVAVVGTPTVNNYTQNVTTVTFNGTGQPVTQSGSWTNTVTQGTNSNLRGSFMIDGSSNTVQITGTPTVNAQQSGSWTDTVVQSGTRWSMAFSTTTTVAVLSSTSSTTGVAISTPIAAVASQTVRVFRLVLTADAATTITFRDSANNFGDSQYLAANGSVVLDLSNEPWYITSSGNAFVIKQSGSANLGVRIWYTQS